jgi:hypothetical protein
MSVLANLKLSTARKPRTFPEAARRRDKLLSKLTEQRELALAHSEGRTYAPKRLRNTRDMITGDKVVREVPIRIKPWFWTGEKNETLISIHYGSKTLELAKGKTAIEVTNLSQLVQVLDTVIEAVKTGELDLQMEAASTKLREGFKK